MLTVTRALGSILSLYPPTLRTELESAMPVLGLAAGRLALEVLDAETKGLSYGEAVEQPTFPLMAKIHFGLLDQLQCRLTPPIIEGIKTLIEHAADGDFDQARKVIFAIATRHEDPEAALARFLLFEAIRLNIYVRTWHAPHLEVWGCIARAEDEAQEVLKALLDVPEMHDDDCRPLNVLVIEMLGRLQRDEAQMMRLLREHVGDVIDEMVVLTEATQVVRAFDAPTAAVFRPGRSAEPLGSQRIADRYPHHFTSANAVDKRRSRFREGFDPDEPPAPSGDRLIDILREAIEREEDVK